MITIKKYCCGTTFSWIRKKCSLSGNDVIPLHTNFVVVRPRNPVNEIGGSSKECPTISCQVEELTFDRNGNPTVNIVKSVLDENSDEELPTQENRWAFQSPSGIIVEDLQQSDGGCGSIEQANSTSENTSGETEVKKWKPSCHLHNYFRMMHICGTAPIVREYGSTGMWKTIYNIQKVNKFNYCHDIF